MTLERSREMECTQFLTHSCYSSAPYCSLIAVVLQVVYFAYSPRSFSSFLFLFSHLVCFVPLYRTHYLLHPFHSFTSSVFLLPPFLGSALSIPSFPLTLVPSCGPYVFSPLFSYAQITPINGLDLKPENNGDPVTVVEVICSTILSLD